MKCRYVCSKCHILKRIHAVEVVEFVRKIPSHSHIALLYTNDNSKDKMLVAYFEYDDNWQRFKRHFFN